MNLIQKPEWINKEKVKKHIQAGMLYVANILWVVGAIVFISGEDWPLWKKALVGAITGAVLIGLCFGAAWLVYTWQ